MEEIYYRPLHEILEENKDVLYFNLDGHLVLDDHEYNERFNKQPLMINNSQLYKYNGKQKAEGYRYLKNIRLTFTK